MTTIDEKIADQLYLKMVPGRDVVYLQYMMVSHGVWNSSSSRYQGRILTF